MDTKMKWSCKNRRGIKYNRANVNNFKTKFSKNTTKNKRRGRMVKIKNN